MKIEIKEPIDGIVGRGKELVVRWDRARRDLDDLRRRVTSAECEVANATNELGKFLVPSDAKEGERVGIWIRDGSDRELFLSATHPRWE